MSHHRILLLVGGPAYHNKPFHYAELAGIFAGDGGYDIRMTSDLDVLTPESLAGFDAVVHWSSGLQPTATQVDALLDAVSNGLGFFGFHGGAASWFSSAAYLRFLGSRFMQHGPYRAFRVDIDDRAHPITAGVQDFLTEDELYELGGNVEEFDAFAEAIAAGKPKEGAIAALGDGPLGPDLHVLASAEGHPLLYTRTWGKGRVHYNALGHDQASLQKPVVRTLVLQGLAWVIGDAPAD
jgi:type 1 glutamine amidotransferase